jgi:uncharacterized protein YnzC (UPF0291/DUF896 family)
MISKELIDRINYLARKSKTEGLTEAEKAEQALVRREYIEAIKLRVKDTLDNTKIIRQELVDDCCDCHSGKCSHHH